MTQANLSVYNTPDVASYWAAMRFISPCEKLLFDRYIAPGLNVLDLGVGGGRTTAYLAPQAAHYVGIDYAEEMIRVCREKFPEFEFLQADASDLSNFSSSSFDVVLMAFNGIDVLHNDARNRCLDECFRVLKPGGTLIFSTHNVRAVLVAPTWSRERVREVAERASRGIPAVRLAAIPLLTFAVVTRAVLWAGWKSFRRCKRLGSSVFWRGEGYVFDPAHGGFFAHYSIPKYVMAEVERHGFHLREMEGSEYPARKGELFTKWYYYVFEKPNGG